MINIALVEDSNYDANLISSYVEMYFKESGKRFKVTRFNNAITFLTGYSSVYDVVFIDIQMPYMDGVEAANKLRELDSVIPIVFITNMANYAIKGYAVNALDFIIKPVEYEAFAHMMKKVSGYIENSAQSIVLKSSSGKIRVLLDSIIYIEVFGHRTIYHTEIGDFTVWKTLKEQESALPGERFAKCNHCCLVNLKHVDTIFDDEVRIRDIVIPVSRSKKKEFGEKLLTFYSKYS